MAESSHSDLDTRGRLLMLLCSGNRTAGELAREVGITPNGVRGHLRQLEAEGLVAYRTVRQGVGKPAHEYRLNPEGSLRLSRAYLPMLAGLLAVVEERSGAREAEAMLRDVGRALGRRHPRPTGGARRRADAAAGLLVQLGAVCSVRPKGEQLSIEGVCCPLRALVADHPLACKAIEALVEEYTGLPTKERCDRDDPPGCRLLIGPTGGDAVGP